MQGDFTLSYHFYRANDARNHFDLFLDTDGESLLETWKHIAYPKREKASEGLLFLHASLHRRVYLTFEGVLSEERGRVRILRRGKFMRKATRESSSASVQDKSCLYLFPADAVSKTPALWVVL